MTQDIMTSSKMHVKIDFDLDVFYLPRVMSHAMIVSPAIRRGDI